MPRRAPLGLSGYFRRAFGNFGLKVLAFLVAVGAWFFITSGRVTYRELSIPLEIVGVPTGYVVNGAPPSTISVRVVGKGRDLYLLRPSDFKATVNVADKAAGVYRFDLTPSDVVYTGGADLKVQAIVSEKILMVELERRVTKSVPVKVAFVGAPEKNMYVGIPDVKPARAALYGSARVLDKITAVSVTVDLAGRREPFTEHVPIRAPAGITLVGANEADVTVPVGLGERRTFGSVPIGIRGAGAASFRVEPAACAVTLEGEKTRLAAAGPIAAYVSAGAPGTAAVRTDVPEFTTLVSIAPVQVELSRVGP